MFRSKWLVFLQGALICILMLPKFLMYWCFRSMCLILFVTADMCTAQRIAAVSSLLGYDAVWLGKCLLTFQSIAVPVSTGSSRVKQGQAGNNTRYTVAYGQALKFGGLLDLEDESIEILRNVCNFARRHGTRNRKTALFEDIADALAQPQRFPLPCDTPQCVWCILLKYVTSNTIQHEPGNFFICKKVCPSAHSVYRCQESRKFVSTTWGIWQLHEVQYTAVTWGTKQLHEVQSSYVRYIAVT
jgi:hypothetical protein